MKPFLILQLRVEDEVSDDEFEAFLRHGHLSPNEVHRIRMERGPLPELDLRSYAGVIVGGGPTCVSTPDEKKDEVQKRYDAWLTDVFKQITAYDIPYLGCCYGLGSFSQYVGGCVSKEQFSESVSGVDVTLTEEGKQDALLAGLPTTFRALVGHMEACQRVPATAVLLASSSTCPVQMIRVGEHGYAVQFHPESTSANFILRVNYYKHAGYFPPEDAEKIIRDVEHEIITVPQEILRRFVARYRDSEEGRND